MSTDPSTGSAPPAGPAPANPADLWRADRACDAFEAAWQGGRPPRIEDFCGSGSDADPALLAELIGVDAEYRRRRGEQPTPGDYVGRFPGLDPEWVERSLSPDGGPSVTAGEQFGKFTLLERVGFGSCGTVWKAYDIQLRRTVALKIPHPGLLASDQARQRFTREGWIAACLRHPGIVNVYEVEEAGGVPVLVQEYVEGKSLKDVLGGGRMSPKEAARVAAQVADALGHAHGHGAVHRDVKPANIIITPGPNQDGHPVLVDFGLALGEDAVGTMTADGQVLGTPAYMAPEQAAGKAHSADARSDVYALGVVLYEMLTGGPPFRGTRVAILRQVLEELPAPPQRMNHRIPKDLETVCLKAMAREPHRRYQTAAEFAADLRRFLAGEQILARPAGWAEGAYRWARRRPTAAALAAVSVVAGAALIGGAVTVSYNVRLNAAYRDVAAARAAEEGERRKLEEAYYLQRMALASREWAAGNAGRVAQLLDQCPPALRTWEWGYFRSALHRDRMTLRHVPPEAEAFSVMGVAYHPDGKRIASAGRDGVLKVWDAVTGREVRRYETERDNAYRKTGLLSLAWSPDGTALAAGTEKGTVAVWRDGEPGSAPRHVLEVVPKGSTYVVAFSPDGTRLAAGGGCFPWVNEDKSSVPNPGVLRAWDTRTWAEAFCVRGRPQSVTGVAFSPDGQRLVTSEGIIRRDNRRHHPGAVAVWDAATGAKVFETAGHDEPAAAVAWDPAGGRVASAGWDHTVRVWDAATGANVRTSDLPSTEVNAIAYAPDGRTFATGGSDGVVRTWDAAAGRPLRAYRGHSQAVNRLAYSPDGASLASASSDGAVKVWDPTRPQEARVLAHDGPVDAIAVRPDGKLLAVGLQAPSAGGPESAFTVWDAASGRDLGRYPTGHQSRVVAMAFDPRTGRLATADMARQVRLGAWSDGVPATDGPPLPGLVGWIAFDLRFRPGGDDLAGATVHGTDRLVVWDARTRRERYHATGGDQRIARCVDYSPDGELTATGLYGGTVLVRRAADGRETARFRAHDRVITAVAFDRAGRTLATASWDLTVKLWRVDPDGTVGPDAPPAVLRGHTQYVLGVAFSPDGRRVVSCGEDGAVKVWDPATGEETLTLSGHSGPVTAVAFTPDGRTVVSSGHDGTVRLWESEPATPGP